MKRTIAHVLLTLTLIFGAVTAAAADSGKWLHIKVDGDDQVMVNLPLSLISAAMTAIPQEIRAEAHNEMNIAFDEVDLDWAQLMELWQSIRDAPEATFVTVESDGQTIEVRKEGDFLLVDTDGDGNDAEVNVRFPLAVVDALLSGPEGTLDLEAAINALAEEADGHIVSVRDGEDTVKIWIDGQNVSSGD